MNETGLTIKETYQLTPQEVVDGASTQAKLLMDIVEKTKCFQIISGKKYLQVEAWETIGAFNRTHAETENIHPIEGTDGVIGYKAAVKLWKDGVCVGGAIMPCYFTENCCKGKEGDAKHKACMSAAQTFATSKAYRMNFSYIAILAGYQPLPAEEITDDMKQDKTQHWCKEHQINYFMKGKMKSFAHPIGDTGEWCHEPSSTIKNKPPKKDEVKDSTQKANSQPRIGSTEYASQKVKNFDIEPPEVRGPGCKTCANHGYVIAGNDAIPCPDCFNKPGTVTGEPEPEPEPEVKVENPPQTAGELLAWVASHSVKGKEPYDKSWVLTNFSWNEKDLNNRLMECYKEILKITGWEPR